MQGRRRRAVVALAGLIVPLVARRMLVAQAQTEGLTIVSYDKVFKEYDVALLPA